MLTLYFEKVSHQARYREAELPAALDWLRDRGEILNVQDLILIASPFVIFGLLFGYDPAVWRFIWDAAVISAGIVVSILPAIFIIALISVHLT